MIKKYFVLFIFISAFSFSQKINPKLKAVIFEMDSLMQNNNEDIVHLFAEDITFGHSNGWTQNKADFKKDFKSNKVLYKKIENIEFKEVKYSGKISSIHRIIHVEGLYKDFAFKMKLSTFEVWKKIKGNWKLWSRQSVELKQ